MESHNQSSIRRITMNKTITFFMVLFLMSSAAALADNLSHSYQFSDENGSRLVRTETPNQGYADDLLSRKLPVRNPHILAQVVWVDRNHQNAIAERVAVTPDGSGIFAGWWLNNERFSAYVSAGMQAPLWAYSQDVDWQMPVDASNNNYAGTGTRLPGFIWSHESPMYEEAIEFDPGYLGRGISFSGDGNLVASVASLNSDEAILVVYDLNLDDTLYTRHFVPTTGLYGVDFSKDGSTIVVSNYGGLLVYNVPNGDLIGTIYNYSQNTAKISADGSLIVIGTFTGVVYLHEWNGSQYESRWIRSTGDDWVTALDVSADGSTVACGTLDFENSQIAGGKFMLFDAESGSTLIDYDEYGDEVGSVALSADGRYAIAGSWGQYGGTFGDVVTCFIRDTDIPIFQLLDDTDEPGSVFGVAISDSGHYAAAGGKAVHAREFGNGGMLYSIKINDPLTNDAAVASIDEPGEFVDPGSSVIPTATFINVGSEDASFTASCVVSNMETDSVVYSASSEINGLPSFSTNVVYFSPDFVMPAEGRYRMEFIASMGGDQDNSNNHLALVIRSWHDLKAVGISSPFDEITLNWPMTGLAIFRNMGSYYETADISLAIYDSTQTEVYSSISTVYGLAPYMEAEVQFDEWNPDRDGSYRAVFSADLSDDRFPDDNTIERNFVVVDEMIYDDGIADNPFWVGPYPNYHNRKFAQRFEPNIDAPFSITNSRFYLGNVNYTGSFDHLAVAKDMDNLPDTANYLAFQANPELSGPGSWTSVDLDGFSNDNLALWVILRWADTDQPGPYIGADNSGILNRQAYWYTDENGWNQYPFFDWMIRLTVQTSTGIESEYFSGLPEKISLLPNYPNPFNPVTNIRFALPDPGRVTIDIYNTLGQKVRTLSDSYFEAGYHTLVWDGKSDASAEVSSGAYYYRLITGDRQITRKMLLLK